MRHIIKNGEQNAPIAAPIVNIAIISPLIKDCCVNYPNVLIMIEVDNVLTHAKQ